MANFVYKSAVYELADGTIDWMGDSIKVMLVDSSYKANREDKVVNLERTDSPSRAEINTVGYERGYGKSGRHTLDTWIDKRMDNWFEYKAKNPAPWLGLGPSNKPIAAAIVVKEYGGSDSFTRLIAYIDTVTDDPPFPFIPLGGKYSLNMNLEGFINTIVMDKEVRRLRNGNR